MMKNISYRGEILLLLVHCRSLSVKNICTSIYRVSHLVCDIHVQVTNKVSLKKTSCYLVFYHPYLPYLCLNSYKKKKL